MHIYIYKEEKILQWYEITSLSQKSHHTPGYDFAIFHDVNENYILLRKKFKRYEKKTITVIEATHING